MRQWLYSDKSRYSTVKTVTWGHLILRPYARKVMFLAEIVYYANYLCCPQSLYLPFIQYIQNEKIKNKKPRYIILFILFVFVLHGHHDVQSPPSYD